MDHGRKFSVIDALAKRNWTRDEKLLDYALGKKRIEKNFSALSFDLDNARLLLQYYWSGMIRPHGKVLRPDTEHLRPSEIVPKLRLKTARKVLDFVAGKVEAKSQQEDSVSSTIMVSRRHKVRVLLVESSFKEVSKRLTQTISDLFLLQQLYQEEQQEESSPEQEQGQKQDSAEEQDSSSSLSSLDPIDDNKNNNNASFVEIFLKHAEFAVVNGEGRGALPLEHLYPKRRTSTLPFFICVDTTSTEVQQEHEQLPSTHHLRAANRFYASAPSFLEFDTVEILEAFNSLVTDEDRMEAIAEWIVKDLKCFDRYRGTKK